MEKITIKEKKMESQYDMNSYWKYRIEEYIRYKEQERMYELEYKKIQLEYKKENEQYE